MFVYLLQKSLIDHRIHSEDMPVMISCVYFFSEMIMLQIIMLHFKTSFLKLPLLGPALGFYEFPHYFVEIKLLFPLLGWQVLVLFQCFRDGDVHIGLYKQLSLGTDCNNIHQ